MGSIPHRTLGVWVSFAISLFTLIAFGIALLTPPLSGPWCKANVCYSYPFNDVGSRFPRDYYWMYPAMIMLVLYTVLMVFINHVSVPKKKIYSEIGLMFACVSSFVLTANYFLQISVVQPSLLNKEIDGISLLTQYNPHGIFIALEDFGYLLMSLSFMFTAFVFSSGTLQKIIRWLFLINAISTISLFILYSFLYGILREYRFEVVSISINWLTLMISGVLLGLLFSKKNIDCLC